MRRAHVGRSDAFVKSEQGEQGFWPSYADMMSAVALILFFLMLLSYTQNIITGNNLRSTQVALSTSEQALTQTQDELARYRQSLLDTQTQLTQTQQQVQSAESELSRITTNLDDARTLLAQQQANLASQTSQIEQQANQIASLQSYRQSAEEQLLSMHQQMQELSVFRFGILEQIRASVAQAMGDSSKVSISDNGSIVLGDGVFFESGKADILPAGEATLYRLIDAFASILSNEQNTRYIDSIVISGHTDQDGTNEDNRTLSTDRANNVLSFILTNDGGRLDPYAMYFSAAGYGEERPIPGTDQSTPEGKAANRRIEISIILRDDSILDMVDSYLNIDLPEGITATVTTEG